MPFRSEKNRHSFTIASIGCLPCCVVLLFYMIPAIWGNFGGPSSHIPDFVFMPGLLAYYLVPSVLGIIYLLFAGVVLILAWMRSPLTPKFRPVLLVVYTVVLLVYVSYVAWWYLTGQQFGYL
jgi:hypothetical protein